MTYRASLAWVTSILPLVAGCRGDGGTPPSPRDAGVRVDAGNPMGDAGPAPIDGSVPDGGMSLDGGHDAGTDAGPPCECPPLPVTCTPTPANAPAFSPAGTALQDQLLGVIACASTSLHVAFYETTWPCLVDALIARLDAVPALALEVMIDDDQCPQLPSGELSCELSRLAAHARVVIVDDGRSAYMHHKFVIADGERVWVSSANATAASFCTDHNNAVVIDDATIVATYEAEFRRLFTTSPTGPTMVRPAVVSMPYSVYFSPQTPADSRPNWFNDLVTRIGSATTAIDFAVFSFTRTEVSDALIAAHMRGVMVRGVVDGSALADPPAMALTAAGVPLRVANVHDKLMVIDGTLVITGSPNWSMNSWSNNENSLWIDDATMGGMYAAELGRVYDAARTPP